MTAASASRPKDRTGPTLTFSPAAWSAFLALATEAQAAKAE
ncbi:DUF397 domain-containing protein [Kitasatospora sp. NPDC056446]